MINKDNFQRVEKKSEIKNSIVRAVFVVLLVVMQFWWIYFLVSYLEGTVTWFSTAMDFITLFLVLTIFSRHLNSNYRMFWMIVVSIFPVLGIPFYALMGRQNSTKRMRERFEAIDAVLFPYLQQDPEVFRDLKEQDVCAAGSANYLIETCRYPVYREEETRFFDDGATGYEDQLREIRKAKRYIFMEYFAIEERGAFQQLFLILQEKVKEGLDVRIIYDDIGSLSFINKEFINHMEEAGIRCVRFNPMVPFINIFMNNRDHRKITVIDGQIGYTGGYNLANEYFHITEPYGFWKDCGVRLEGEAVRSLTVTFLEMWNLINKTDPMIDAGKYLAETPVESRTVENGEERRSDSAFLQPYADTPLDDEATGEEVYMNILRYAQDYVWFVTPYLLITDEMRREMIGAAKRGVDVRIITPGIPDKKIVYQETRSYYSGLVRGGVRIFEYTPGFSHAKMCVSDGRIATVGTINLDYRSLYLHFEDGVQFFGGHIVDEVKTDFDRMFEVSEEVGDRYRKGAQTVFQRSYRAVLRFLAPQL